MAQSLADRMLNIVVSTSSRGKLAAAVYSSSEKSLTNSIQRCGVTRVANVVCEAISRSTRRLRGFVHDSPCAHLLLATHENVTNSPQRASDQL
jgi:hypothetical protein